MLHDVSVLTAFADELSKIAASHGAMNVLSARKGTRPIRVSKLLEKEKAGTLWKQTSFESAQVTGPSRRMVEGEMQDLPPDVANSYRWEKLHEQESTSRVCR